MEALSPTPPRTLGLRKFQVHTELEDTGFLTWDSLHSFHVDRAERTRKQLMDEALEYSILRTEASTQTDAGGHCW